MIEPLKNVLYIARRFKLATAFNLIGLIVAFAAFYLMMTQIIYQVTYNHGIKDYERIYRLDTDFMNDYGLYSDKIFYPFADALHQIPEIESVSLLPYIEKYPGVASLYNIRFVTDDGDTLKFSSEYGCNKTAVSTFTSNALSGELSWTDQDTAKNSKPGVIIPKSIAMRYFNSTDIVGTSMLAIDTSTEDTVQWKVRAVYEDFPENSEIKNCIYTFMRDEDSNKFKFNKTYYCYVKFKQVPQNVDTLNNSLKKAIVEMMEKGGWKKYADSASMTDSLFKHVINDMHIRFTPLKYSYFETKTISSGKHGFMTMSIILGLACLLLIIIAAIHFLNHLLVESPMRIRGVNTRLVLGAPRQVIKRDLIIEGVITTVFASIIALAICGALSSWLVANQLIDGSISLKKNWILALITIIVAATVGIVASIYPTTYITSLVPTVALKGNFGLTVQGNKIRKTIVACQLFIAFLMVIYLGTIIQQLSFIYNAPYNYNKDEVFISTIPLATNDSVRQRLYKELVALPSVNNVSFSDGSLGLFDNHSSQLIVVQEHRLGFLHTYVDTAYMHTMGIEMVKGKGRSFLPTDKAAAIINKSAMEQWPWMEIDSKIPSELSADSLTIVGVCEDIRYNSMRFNSNQPFIFIIQEGYPYSLTLNVNFEKNANFDDDFDTANGILKKFFDKEMTPLVSFEKKLEDTYESEFRFFKWILFLSIVCTLITLIGVYCLMMFESEYRRKEIGIRKIVGATTGEVVWMLCKQYIPLILISFAVAAPFATISGYLTLTYFAEHVPLVNIWWVFPLALVIVGGIVMVTILLQSWRTARENPVNSIKSE